MNGALLQDLIRAGLGRAAVVMGVFCSAYRPSGTGNPLVPENRYLSLPASFTSAAGYNQPVGYGQPVWHGIFDAAYTLPGDYIVRPASTPAADDGGIWFIASQQPLLPVLCIRTTRIVSFARPGSPAAAGVNTYGGISAATATPLAALWPASVLSAGGSGLDTAGLPADAAPGAWSVLLPAIPGLELLTGDLVTDDIGRTGVIAASELTELGWRLLVRQATT